MRKQVIGLLGICLLLALPVIAQDESSSIVTALRHVSMRSQPESGAALVVFVEKDDTLVVLAVVENGLSIQGNMRWYQVQTDDGITGYVWSGAFTELEVDAQPATAVVSARQTNLRAEASGSSTLLDTLTGGQSVTILDAEPDGETINGVSLWYRVLTASNKEGYVWSGTLDVPQAVTRTATTRYYANLRDVATNTGRIIAVIPVGEAVTILAEVRRGQSLNGNRLWYRVETAVGEIGFIWSGALSEISETSAGG